MSLATLRLLHLADSAFPIGATAHSFGLETLVAQGNLTPQTLGSFLCDLLQEAGRLEALLGRLAYRCGRRGESAALDQWLQLNRWFAALKPARESREASAALGRRFLQTVAHLEATTTLQQAQTMAQQAAVEIHYCAAFGLVGGALRLGEEETVLAYLQQSMMGLVSASLRLLPMGQGRASEILWELKAPIAAIAAASSQMAPVSKAGTDMLVWLDQVATFTPLLDLASMRHPGLSTRLFIS